MKFNFQSYPEVLMVDSTYKLNNCDLILENRPCTHIPGFWEIQIWNAKSGVGSLYLIVATQDLQQK